MSKRARALELLRAGTGNPDADFRDGQEDAIRAVIAGKERQLVVQRTGWGKSSVYFISAKLLREADQGVTILISPLLALMRNQLDAASRMGVVARTINSDNTEDWAQVEAEILRDEVDVLLISPERLSNPRFRDNVLTHLMDKVAMLVIDEAHCISDWGHDFRPHYRFIERIVKLLPRNVRLLATTATANGRVIEDLRAVLGPDINTCQGELARDSLYLQTIRLASQSARLAWLATHLPKLPGSGIVYALTIRDVEMIAAWLKSRGINAEAYSGETGERRPMLEEALTKNRLKVLVATPALGMGFDKPDLAFVIHFQTPGSVVAYYQQVGRAGRAISSAYGILLSGSEETDITGFFIKSAFPKVEETTEILTLLESEDNGLSVPEILRRVNMSNGRVEKALLLMSLESPAPIVKEGPKWKRTPADLSPDFWARAERLTELRRAEQAQMQDYVKLKTDHMEFLIAALDGDVGAISTPDISPVPDDFDEDEEALAVEFLKRTELPIEPRQMWPGGGLEKLNVKGHIHETHRAQPGRALSIWKDAGWGRKVADGKYPKGRNSHFSEELVEAVALMVEKWKPGVTWVTCIPSLRHPELVPDFARRLANRLRLPFRVTMRKTDARPEQKTMANSPKQAANVDGALAIDAGQVLEGPVLLVDDVVDSRWTLTIAAYLLTTHGSGLVFPVALATAAHDDE